MDNDTIFLRLLTSDMVFYVVMAMVVSLPLFLLVAAVCGCSLADSRRRTMGFLKTWGDVVPERLRGSIAGALGFFGGFLFLIMLAYLCNSAGSVVLPQVLRAVDFPGGNAKATWFAEHFDAWKAFEARYQIAAAAEDAEFDWWEAKKGLGMPIVRAFRVVFAASWLLLVAGIVDLATRDTRRRGLLLALLGLMCVYLFASLWADKRAHFMTRLWRANQQLDASAEPPDEMVGLMEGSALSPR